MAYGSRGLGLSWINRWWAQRVKKPDAEVEELPESNLAPADEHTAADKLRDERDADRATERD